VTLLSPLPPRGAARHSSHLESSPRLALVRNYYRCQKSLSPRSSFPHRDPIWRWRSNSRRSTEGQQAARGAQGQGLSGLTMVDASPGAGSPELRQQPRPWRPQPVPPPPPPLSAAGHGLRAAVEAGVGLGAGVEGAAEAAAGVEHGGVRAGSAGAETAALPLGMQPGGNGAALQGGAEPRLRAAAARSRRIPAHHLPPGRRLPLRPRRARLGPQARGALARAPRRRIPPDKRGLGEQGGREGLPEGLPEGPASETRVPRR
jgi:hypothetical protein